MHLPIPLVILMRAPPATVQEKATAVAAEDFVRAAALKREITALASVVAGATLGAAGSGGGGAAAAGGGGGGGVTAETAEERAKRLAATVAALNRDMAAAVGREDFAGASELKAEIDRLSKANGGGKAGRGHRNLRIMG